MATAAAGVTGVVVRMEPAADSSPAPAAGGRHPSPEAEYRARLLDALGQAVIATDATGIVRYWNRHAEALYGWTSAEALGRPVHDLTAAPVGQPAAADIMSAFAAGVPWTGAIPVRRKDGSAFVALVTDAGLYDARGDLEGIIGISVNLGEALRPYLVQASEAAVVHGVDGVVHYASPAVSAVFGWDDEALVGRDLADVLHVDDVGVLQECMAAAAGGQAAATAELRIRRSEGDYVWAEGRWTNLLADPSIRGLVVIFRDVHERHLTLDRMTDLALKDPLTGLPNRSVLVERLEHAAVRRRQQGAVLFVDLDDFKRVNDTLGHAAGDRLLQAVADRLRRAVRPEDTCGRWAGDEFLVVTESVGTRAEAEALTARVREAIEQPLVLEDRTVHPRASIGLALIAEGHTADQVLRIADQEMYAVKRRRRRDSFVVLPPGS